MKGFRVKKYGQAGFAVRLADGRSEYFARSAGDFYVTGGVKTWREAGLQKLAALGFEFGNGKRAPTITELMAGNTRARTAA